MGNVSSIREEDKEWQQQKQQQHMGEAQEGDYDVGRYSLDLMGQSPLQNPRRGATESPLLFTPQTPMEPLQRPDELNIQSESQIQSLPEYEDSFYKQGIPTMITWSHGGNKVKVEGSWDNWKSGKSLQRSGKDFTIIKVLPPGFYQFRFIADGERRHAPDLPWTHDETGTAYNILDLKDYVPDAVESIACFEPPRSPEASYNNCPLSSEDYAKEPPMVIMETSAFFPNEQHDKNFTTAFSSLHYHFFNSQAGETRNSSAMVESIEKEKIYAMIKLRRTQLMRKVIKVSLVSTAIIFFLSNSSWIPSFLNSTTPQLFFLWHTNRAVMFIICNAILLFLIKDSGLLRIHQSSDDCLYDILIKEETHDERFEEGDMEAFVVLDDDEGELADGEWESDDEGESVGCLDIVAVAEEEEIDEELNKVFDEFIERFKRERRLEAMQLVVV